jgi:hypothetical protein
MLPTTRRDRAASPHLGFRVRLGSAGLARTVTVILIDMPEPAFSREG